MFFRKAQTPSEPLHKAWPRTPDKERLYKMEIMLGKESDIDSWMRLVNKVKENFPGLETKEDLENNPQFLKYYMKWKRKEITLSEMQRLLGVKSRTTCYNWIKLIEKGN